MLLQGRTALITGASKGIGYGLAIGLAREGADIIANYHSDAKGASQVVSRVEELGRKAIAIKADVSKGDEVESMVTESIAKFGKIDILVNNAGIALWKPFFEVTEEMWDRTLDVNLKGVFLCSQVVARHMLKNKIGGRIINISSIAAHGAMKCLAPYCASKGGMTLLTMEMALELAPYKINVNAVAPGTIRIERNVKEDPDYPDNWLGYLPQGRVGEPEDIVGPVVFLASAQSEYVTGQIFYVDGGLVSYVPIPEPKFASPQAKK